MIFDIYMLRVFKVLVFLNSNFDVGNYVLYIDIIFFMINLSFKI